MKQTKFVSKQFGGVKQFGELFQPEPRNKKSEVKGWRYDLPSKSQQFVFHTPNLTSTKWCEQSSLYLQYPKVPQTF